ncbi:MAG: hypothetical protein H6737_25370 [Alphaproteobacteria bacterium]|nr:hypothetical protein [Alphaproteobacteria bacterium]
MDDTVAELLEGLASEDVATRALTVQRVRQVDLDSMELLDRVLALCNDLTPLPDAMQPPAPDDPFADFFGQSKSAAPKVAVAQKAAERLVFTGVIGKPQTAEHLAAALGASPSEHLVKACAKILGETVWSDRLGAVKVLVPALHRADAALYEVVVRMGENEHRVMIRSALDPYNSRAINELLNHGPSKAMMEDALTEAVVGGHIDLSEKDAADALTLLVSWDSRHAAQVAAALEPKHHWAILVRGLSEAGAAQQLRAWLDAGSPAPLALVRKLGEALKTRQDVPFFPIDAWLRYAQAGVDIVRHWKAAGRCRAELEQFVQTWAATGEAAERAWESIEALVEAGLHANVGGAVLKGLERDAEEPYWSRRRFEILANAEPRIDGLLDAMAALALRRPETSRMVVPALLQAWPAEALRGLTERYIALAESRPLVRKPSRKGLIHEERDGVDTAPFQDVVSLLDDALLKARLQDVLPYVRAE